MPKTVVGFLLGLQHCGSNTKTNPGPLDASRCSTTEFPQAPATGLEIETAPLPGCSEDPY